MIKFIFAVCVCVNVAVSETVIQYINKTPQLSTLANAIKDAGLEQTLNDTSQNFTILAPDSFVLLFFILCWRYFIYI